MFKNKFTTLEKNHGICIDQEDLIAISDIGCLIAQLKEGFLYILKMDGTVLKMIEFGKVNVRKIYWCGLNIVLFGDNRLDLVNPARNIVTDTRKLKLIGSNVKNSRILAVTTSNYKILEIKNDKFCEIEQCSLFRAINIFGHVDSFVFKPKIFTPSEILLKKLKIKTFPIENGIKNEMIQIDDKNQNSRKSTISRHKTSYYIKNRSLSAKYQNGTLSISQNSKKIFYFHANINFIKISKKIVVFTTDRKLFVYKNQTLKKYAINVLFLGVTKNGFIIITEKKVRFLHSKDLIEYKHSKIFSKVGILYLGEKLADILPILQFCNEEKAIIHLLKKYKMCIYKHIEMYFKNLCIGNYSDSYIIECLRKMCKKYKITQFYEFALLARLNDRIELSQFLIMKEKNFTNKKRFFIRFKDNTSVMRFILEEENHLLLYSFFNDMGKYYTREDILTITKNENVFRKYKNYIKNFQDEFFIFIKNSNRTDDVLHVNLLNSSVDLSIPVKKEFNTKIIQILSKFYFLKEFISENYNCDILTVDSAIKFLLKKNDKKNAFFLKYTSVMCKEKFNHLKKSLVRLE